MSHTKSNNNHIDFSDIPKMNNGRNDWCACVGKSIRFHYGTISDKLNVIAYEPDKTLLHVEYNGVVSSIYVAQLVKAQLGNVIGAINHNYSFQLNEVIPTTSGNIMILEHTTKLDARGWKQKAYRYKCLQCGHIGIKLEGSIKKHSGCEVCTGMIVEERNCIAKTSPELLQYLVNPEEGYLYSRGSMKKVKVQCPDCKNVFMVTVAKLISRGLRCQFCGDGVSVPEKYAAELLAQIANQTGVQFSHQVKFEWSAPLVYDFVCEDRKIIIETHGMQHYQSGFGHRGRRSLIEEQENDARKAMLAKNNGYQLLTIDCRYSENDFLRNAFSTSVLLNKIFPTVLIDYEACFACSQKTLVKDVAELFNSGKTRNEIAKQLDIGATTVSRYLQRATSLGWCQYNPKTEMRKSAKQNAPDRKIKVCCNETGEIFDSLSAAAQWCNTSVSSISTYLNDKKRKLSAGKHPETKQKLTWSIVE